MVSNNLSLPGTFSPVGLKRKPGTEVEWQRIGDALEVIENSKPWLIGDWFNAEKWNLNMRQECERRGINYGTAKNCAMVCRDYKRSRRRDLSFKHHQEAMRAQPEDRQQWLTWAIENQASCAALREEIKAEHERLTVEVEAESEVEADDTPQADPQPERPTQEEPSPEPEEPQPQEPTTWTCPICESVHSKDVEVCGCEALQEDEQDDEPMWTCTECGNEYPMEVQACSCQSAEVVEQSSNLLPNLSSHSRFRQAQVAEWRRDQLNAKRLERMATMAGSFARSVSQLAGEFASIMEIGSIEDRRHAKTVRSKGPRIIQAYMALGISPSREEEFFSEKEEERDETDADDGNIIDV